MGVGLSGRAPGKPSAGVLKPAPRKQLAIFFLSFFGHQLIPVSLIKTGKQKLACKSCYLCILYARLWVDKVREIQVRGNYSLEADSV